MGPAALAAQLRALATSLGIDALEFATASEFQGYMLGHSIRRDPRLTMADARTIIVAGIYIGGVVLPSWGEPTVGRTSRLYLSGFFCDVVEPLAPLAALLRAEGYTALVCDSSRRDRSILPLKLAAVRAGLGWQGKNSLLVTRQFGTFLALGGILTDADLEPNSAEEPNRCQGCDKCQRACPMGALEQPCVLDKDRCLSYLLQCDDLPEAARAAQGNRVQDCEICQEACPWNTRHIARPLATATTEAFRSSVPRWEAFFALPRLARLSERQYRRTLGPLRTGIPYRIFERNVTLAVERLPQR